MNDIVRNGDNAFVMGMALFNEVAALGSDITASLVTDIEASGQFDSEDVFLILNSNNNDVLDFDDDFATNCDLFARVVDYLNRYFPEMMNQYGLDVVEDCDEVAEQKLSDLQLQSTQQNEMTIICNQIPPKGDIWRLFGDYNPNNLERYQAIQYIGPLEYVDDTCAKVVIGLVDGSTRMLVLMQRQDRIATLPNTIGTALNQTIEQKYHEFCLTVALTIPIDDYKMYVTMKKLVREMQVRDVKTKQKILAAGILGATTYLFSIKVAKISAPYNLELAGLNSTILELQEMEQAIATTKAAYKRLEAVMHAEMTQAGQQVMTELRLSDPARYGAMTREQFWADLGWQEANSVRVKPIQAKYRHQLDQTFDAKMYAINRSHTIRAQNNWHDVGEIDVVKELRDIPKPTVLQKYATTTQPLSTKAGRLTAGFRAVGFAAGVYFVYEVVLQTWHRFEPSEAMQKREDLGKIFAEGETYADFQRSLNDDEALRDDLRIAYWVLKKNGILEELDIDY